MGALQPSQLLFYFAQEGSVASLLRLLRCPPRLRGLVAVDRSTGKNGIYRSGDFSSVYHRLAAASWATINEEPQSEITRQYTVIHSTDVNRYCHGCYDIADQQWFNNMLKYRPWP
eukprot:scaffold36822_cov34-Prasinocladus_malaysianus.AAC.2